MPITKEMPASDSSAPAPTQSDWPELISSPVLLVWQGGKWSAVLINFSIVGVGETLGLAWQQMDELALDYLEDCERQGLPYTEVIRKMPFSSRLKFWLMYLVFGVLLRPFTRGRRPGERRFVVPHPNSHHAATC